MEFFGYACSIKYRAMMFLIRVKAVSVSIKAKGFAHQPICTFRVNGILFAIRFVAKTTKPLTVRKQGIEAKLLLLS